jgi:hypothetical protein
MKKTLVLGLVFAFLTMGCSGDPADADPSDPLTVDLDKDGHLGAFDCNDGDASIGLCLVGDVCSVDTQCGAAACAEGLCACPTGFGGADCTECADPRLTGEACATCLPQFSGPNCESCVSGLAGDNCDSCANPNFAAPGCAECVAGFVGGACDKCANDHMAYPGCNSCIEGFEGEDCSIELPCEWDANAPIGITFNEHLPDFWFEDAYFPSGYKGLLDMKLVKCDDGYSDYKTMLFITSSGWCPNCPNYIKYVASLKEQLDEHGVMLVFLILENKFGALINSVGANAYVNGYAGPGVGYRAGLLDMLPDQSPVSESPQDAELAAQGLTEGFFMAVPGAFVVRTRDMKVIASQYRSDYLLPFVKIAANPERDWSDPSNFQNMCGPDDEESLEPNDSPDDLTDAHYLWPGGDIHGGICAQQPDFYQMQLQGPWRIELEHDSSVGDLDVYVWNTDYNSPQMDDDGNPIASTGTGDLEVLEHQNNAVIMVTGGGFFSAPYTLRVVWPLEGE